MNAPAPQSPHALSIDIEARVHALLQLRRQMLVLHARLEYLRLMLRLSRPLAPGRGHGAA